MTLAEIESETKQSSAYFNQILNKGYYTIRV